MAARLIEARQMASHGQSTLLEHGLEEPAAGVPEGQRRLTQFEDPHPQDEIAGDAWEPDPDGLPCCDRCDAVVSHRFHQMWRDNDGVLDGCRQCLPRSVRFGEDVYGRDPDDIEFDPDAPNKGRDPAPSSQQVDYHLDDDG